MISEEQPCKPMSFYSYIQIFRPGRPLVMGLGELRAICDTLREVFSLEDDFHILDISYQHPADSWDDINWDETGTISTNKQGSDNRASDYAKDSSVWQQIWPDELYNNNAIWRAFVGLAAC